MIKTFSKKSNGETKLTPNFKVREFACQDGSDTVKIDESLPIGLQALRNYFGKAINITSGFRTATHNKRVGGSTNSQHLYGRAADIKISGVTPSEVCKIAQTIGFNGIGVYGTFSHVDTRASKSYFKNGTISLKTHNGYAEPTNDLLSGSRGGGVRWAQIHLLAHGYKLPIYGADGKYGGETIDAVRAFQGAHGLKVDGWVGEKTRGKLRFF